jgi:hypothetical protein
MTPVYPNRQPNTKTRIGKKLLVYIITVFLSQYLLAQPTITSFSPTSGAIGTTVTITGSNFSATAADNTVLFGSVKATVSAASTTSLTVTVPAGASNGTITVTTNYLTAFSAQPFLVTNTYGGTIDANAFAAGTSFIAGSDAPCIAIGDLNADGKPDLVSASPYSNLISVVRNQSAPGTLAMAAKIDYSTGSQPMGVTIGDVNGDGKPDIVVANSLSNSVSVYRNTGTGSTITFDAGVSFPAAYTPQNVFIRDMDGDGKPELVVGNYSTYVDVLRNTGTGGSISFAPKVAFEMIAPTEKLFVDDVDGDGKPDVLATYRSGSITDPCGFAVLRNTSTPGSLSFAAKMSFITGTTPPEAISLSDIDNDGKPEVAVLLKSFNRLSLLRNTSTAGSISFDTQVDYTTENSPVQLAIDDLDGDGLRDIAVVYDPNSQAVSVFKNAGSPGTISLAPFINYSFHYSNILSIADMDIDGKPDIVTAQAMSNSVAFTRNIIKEPVVTSFTPTEGLGGTTVSITGINFTGTTSVQFGGIAASSFTVVSDTEITAVVGVSGGSGRVTVRNQSGSGYKDGFNFIYPPFISAYSPGFGPSTTTVTITGGRFTNATAVSFGGVPALSFTVVNANTITAVVGAGASGSVSVTTPAGTGSRPGFTFLPRSPHVASFSPAAGSAGETITLTGLGFYGVTSVSFNGTQAASFTVVSPTTITAVLGNGSSGWINVNTQFNGSGGIAGFQYTTLPVISSFTPASASTGETITISGGNFTGATSITLGGTPVTSFTVVSPGVITAVVGTGATGDLSVTTATGTATLPGFTLMPPLAIPGPVISSFAPATAITGETVTITGTGFSGATAVSLGGKPAASFTVVSSTTITAVVGDGATGDMVVTTPHGTAAMRGFVYVKLPTNVIVYPNPARGFVWVKHPVSSNTMQLQVLDMTGKVHRTVVVPVGIFQTRIDVHGLPAGCYRVVLSGGGYRLSENLVVQ